MFIKAKMPVVNKMIRKILHFANCVCPLKKPSQFQPNPPTYTLKISVWNFLIYLRNEVGNIFLIYF